MSDNLPDYLKQYAAISNQDADAMSSVKVSVPRISLKGKRFKFINGEDESKGANEIHVAILAVEPAGQLMSKTFYKAGYNPNDTAPPDCASSNGISPDGWVSEPCAELCAKCPNNMFGSATSQSGKKTKACKDSKVLWVAKPDDIGGIVYGLKVPVTSLKPMSEYGKEIKSIGVPLAAIITKLTMDEDNEFPLLQFERAAFLNEEQGVKAMERSQSREWINHEAPTMLDAPNKGAERIEYKNVQSDVSVDVADVQGKTAENLAEISKKW